MLVADWAPVGAGPPRTAFDSATFSPSGHAVVTLDVNETIGALTVVGSLAERLHTIVTRSTSLNTDIVLRIGRHGQPAVGLSGDDGALLRCSRRSAPGGIDIGFVGQIDHVDPGVIKHIARDYIPVVASVGADAEGNSYNVNADEAAGAVAGAIGAYKVVFLTDVAGWLADAEDPHSLIQRATVGEVQRQLGGLDGGMRPKLEACVAAINEGVSAAHILDGRLAHSLLLELFTDEGTGTMIEAAP